MRLAKTIIELNDSYMCPTYTHRYGRETYISVRRKQLIEPKDSYVCYFIYPVEDLCMYISRI